MQETAYANLPRAQSYLAHHYGPNVRLLGCAVLQSQLACLCDETTTQPRITQLVRALYQGLVRQAIGEVWPSRPTAIKTRMHASTPQARGIWHGDVLDTQQTAVAVNMARAGTLPSQVTYEMLNDLFDPAGIRQDHIYMNRVTDDDGRVTGVNVAGSKIGGDIGGRIVIIADPMGATGGSMARTIDMYKARSAAPARCIMALHLIVTPEYLRRLLDQHPEVLIYAIRLDRGMSPSEVMTGALGARWQDEKGLNEQQYIIPGAGGLGEILNNSYV